LTLAASGRRLDDEMKAIITTFDEKAVALTLATIGPMDEVEKERLNDLFRSSAVVELHVDQADHQEAGARITLSADPGSA
jgi:hypothetical protein